MDETKISDTDTFLFIGRTIRMIESLHVLFETCPREPFVPNDKIFVITSELSRFQIHLKTAKSQMSAEFHQMSAVFHQMSAELEKLKTRLIDSPKKLSLTSGLTTLYAMKFGMITKRKQVMSVINAKLDRLIFGDN